MNDENKVNEGITDPSDGSIPNDANAENVPDQPDGVEVERETHVTETVTETPADDNGSESDSSGSDSSE